uniref:NADPH-dependent FMN reductase n=1 Tax=Streptococcus sobrinus TaxID=1310 RepID=UPI0003785878
ARSEMCIRDSTIPAPLSSTLEWIAYTSRPLINKPVMIVGVSLGLLGTSRAQAHLRQILDAPELKARVMPGNEFLLGHSEQVLTDEGELTNADKVAELEDCFAEFLEFVSLTNQLVKEADTKRKQAFAWEAAD